MSWPLAFVIGFFTGGGLVVLRLAPRLYAKWTVITEPVEEGEMGGVGVFVTNGVRKTMITRVAYQRHMTRNASVPFDDQLINAVDRITQVASTMNQVNAGGNLLEEYTE